MNSPSRGRRDAAARSASVVIVGASMNSPSRGRRDSDCAGGRRPPQRVAASMNSPSRGRRDTATPTGRGTREPRLDELAVTRTARRVSPRRAGRAAQEASMNSPSRGRRDTDTAAKAAQAFARLDELAVTRTARRAMGEGGAPLSRGRLDELAVTRTARRSVPGAARGASPGRLDELAVTRTARPPAPRPPEASPRLDELAVTRTARHVCKPSKLRDSPWASCPSRSQRICQHAEVRRRGKALDAQQLVRGPSAPCPILEAQEQIASGERLPAHDVALVMDLPADHRARHDEPDVLLEPVLRSARIAVRPLGRGRPTDHSPRPRAPHDRIATCQRLPQQR